MKLFPFDISINSYVVEYLISHQSLGANQARKLEKNYTWDRSWLQNYKSISVTVFLSLALSLHPPLCPRSGLLL